MHVGDVCDALLCYIYSIAASRCHFARMKCTFVIALKRVKTLHTRIAYASAIAEHLSAIADLANTSCYFISITFNN